MNKDQTEGHGKDIKGSIKETVGKAVGSKDTEREGQADQAEGKVQNAWGSAKDKAREIFGSDDKGDTK